MMFSHKKDYLYIKLVTVTMYNNISKVRKIRVSGFGVLTINILLRLKALSISLYDTLLLGNYPYFKSKCANILGCRPLGDALAAERNLKV